MVEPGVLSDVFPEFGVVELHAGQVEDAVVGRVGFVEELGHCVAGVAVQLFEALGWEGHGDDAGSDVGEVEVVAALSQTLLFPRNDGTKKVHIAYELTHWNQSSVSGSKTSDSIRAYQG